MSEKVGMRPQKADLARLYKGVAASYETSSNLKWDWQTGDKNRVLQGYILYCEEAGVRDSEKIPEMVDLFLNFVATKSKDWVRWSHASRMNYIGFVLKRDAIVLSGQNINPKNSKGASDLNIAGTGGAETWDF